MTPDRIISAMAGLDGAHKQCDCGNPKCRFNPDYTLDLNATQRVLRGLSAANLERALFRLHNILSGDANCICSHWNCLERFALATPLQWCEAILKACGKWEDEE